MRPFQHFLEAGEITAIEPDLELAKLILFDAKARLEIASEMPLDEKRARVIFELVFDSIKKLVEVILLADGYKSITSEAALSYLQKFEEFSETELFELEKFRRIAFSSKYHGKPASLQDALEIRRMFPKIKSRLIKHIKTRLL